MNENALKVLSLGRKVYSKFFLRPIDPQAEVDYRGQQASDLIKAKLLEDKPTMICRFGSTELNCLLTNINLKQHPNDYLKYIKGEIDFLSWQKSSYAMSMLSGFFPPTPAMLERFSQLMLEDMKYVDILGAWCVGERFFKNELAHAIKVPLEDLEPYYHKEPWSEILRGKRILVIHPFEESVKSQYLKHELLFKDKRVLPNFELKTIKAVQSLVENPTGFKDWFEALDFMKDKINKTEFDIAILGCGAYGFPLAAHIKRIGKKAVHLGGATQILFGIKGKRWESIPSISALMNEHWQRPLPQEALNGGHQVEGGCYW